MQEKTPFNSLFFKFLRGVLIIMTLSVAIFAYILYLGYEGVLAQIRSFIPVTLFRELETNIYTTWFIGASSFVVTIILAVLFSIIFTKRILAPFYHIIEVIKEVKRGNYDIAAEVHTNDELEELAQELNLLIQRLKENQERLEDEKAILEIRVRARTRELQELAQSLDEKVKERTRELERRLRELEKFHKLTVGREMQMIELKKQIKELTKKLQECQKTNKIQSQ